jgi:hypothetical protein
VSFFHPCNQIPVCYVVLQSLQFSVCIFCHSCSLVEWPARHLNAYGIIDIFLSSDCKHCARNLSFFAFILAGHFLAFVLILQMRIISFLLFLFMEAVYLVVILSWISQISNFPAPVWVAMCSILVCTLTAICSRPPSTARLSVTVLLLLIG